MLKILCFFPLAVLLFSGCQRGKQAIDAKIETVALVGSEESAEKPAEEVVIIEAAIVETAEPVFAIIPANARPGEPITVVFYDESISGSARSFQTALLDSKGRRIAKALFFSLPEEEETRVAVFAVPSTALTGEAVILIESGSETGYKTIKELPFTIGSREFRSETIPLNQENTDLRTVPDPQKTAESELLWAILSRTGTGIYSGDQFVPPVSSTRRTSSYGSRRVYEYANGKSDTTIHAGVDYGVPTGTEVLACAAGKVVLARNRIVTGNTVILEHLPGLYSLYYHMDSIAVSEETVVEAKTILGESGSTGLATGPHLHWEIRVSGENADPDAFLSRPILDKTEILNKLAFTKL
jgi:murein DD-endopeptidase MepM/ murein hydrolase activator NlpD